MQLVMEMCGFENSENYDESFTDGVWKEIWRNKREADQRDLNIV